MSYLSLNKSLFSFAYKSQEPFHLAPSKPLARADFPNKVQAKSVGSGTVSKPVKDWI